MNNVIFSPTSDAIQTLERLYTKFDLSASGYPTTQWENRNIREYALEHRLRWYWAPDIYLTKIKVNRRMVDPLAHVLQEIFGTWDYRLVQEYNLDVFVRCYCFGCEDVPNPFWWGAGYRLSRLVSGVPLEETIKIFTRHGFSWVGATDKKAERDFHYL